MNGTRGVVIVGGAALAGVMLSGCFFRATPPPPNVPSVGPSSFSFGGVQGGTGQLPSNWPSDVPTPSGMTVDNAVDLGAMGMTATFSGDVDIQAEMNALASQFTAQGWTEEIGLGAPSASGGILIFSKGNQKATVTGSVENGEAVILIATVPDAG